MFIAWSRPHLQFRHPRLCIELKDQPAARFASAFGHRFENSHGESICGRPVIAWSVAVARRWIKLEPT